LGDHFPKFFLFYVLHQTVGTFIQIPRMATNFFESPLLPCGSILSLPLISLLRLEWWRGVLVFSKRRWVLLSPGFFLWLFSSTFFAVRLVFPSPVGFAGTGSEIGYKFGVGKGDAVPLILRLGSYILI